MVKERHVESCIVDSIFNNEYNSGDKLEPERELALKFKCSRPVVHRAIIRLEEKGLVRIIPRKCVVVLDYKLCGKLSLLEHIILKEKDNISRKLNHDMLMFIKNNFISLVEYFRNEKKLPNNISLKGENDYFKFLMDYAKQTNNIVNIMLLNEFKVGILNVTESILNNKQLRDHFLEIESLVIEKKIDKAISLIHFTFEEIEHLWIGGENEI